MPKPTIKNAEKGFEFRYDDDTWSLLRVVDDGEIIPSRTAEGVPVEANNKRRNLWWAVNETHPMVPSIVICLDLF